MNCENIVKQCLEGMRVTGDNVIRLLYRVSPEKAERWIFSTCTPRVHMLQLHSLCGGIEYMLALAHLLSKTEAALLGFYPESYS